MTRGQWVRIVRPKMMLLMTIMSTKHQPLLASLHPGVCAYAELYSSIQNSTVRYKTRLREIQNSTPFGLAYWTMFNDSQADFSRMYLTSQPVSHDPKILHWARKQSVTMEKPLLIIWYTIIAACATGIDSYGRNRIRAITLSLNIGNPHTLRWHQWRKPNHDCHQKRFHFWNKRVIYAENIRSYSVTKCIAVGALLP
jgi:hypothetical protein